MKFHTIPKADVRKFQRVLQILLLVLLRLISGETLEIDNEGLFQTLTSINLYERSNQPLPAYKINLVLML